MTDLEILNLLAWGQVIILIVVIIDFILTHRK